MQHPTPSAATTLPGWSAKQLLVRGGVGEAVAIVAALAVTTEGILPGRWWYWAASFGSICLIALAVGLTVQLRGYAKAKREVALGYTTLWKTAVEQPEISFLEGNLATVISGPGEPRPLSTRRADMRAYLDARQDRTSSTT